MKSLNEMFHHDKLVDIEETISSEFAQLESGYYDAKLCCYAIIYHCNRHKKT